MHKHKLFKLSWVLTTFDRASIYAISGRLISALGSIAIFVLMATVLSRSLQGYFVTFFSVATIQLLFDLGLSTVMINFVAHEWTLANRETGDAPISHYEGLAVLAKFAFRWYGVAAFAMFVFFQPLGWYLFADAHDPRVWPAPWLALSFVVSMDLSLFGAWTILEGCNEVRSVYGYRAIRTAGLALGTALGLWLGAGLWSVAVGYLAAFPAALYILLGKHRQFLAKLITTATHERLVWHTELLPMQWQTWLTALANYASVWAITPITLKILGPVDAGRVGLTWMAINAVSGVAFIVVIVKAPTFGALVARRAYRELDRLALKCGGTSILLSSLGCGFLGATVFVLNVFQFPYAGRVLPLEPTVILLVTAVLGQAVGAQLTYLRAFRREPYPAIQISFAALVVFSVMVGSHYFGMMGIALGSFAATVLFYVPLATYSTFHFRRLLMASTALR